MKSIGVDVAREGGDRSVAIVREDNRVLLIEDWSKEDIPHSADRVERLYRRYGADEIVIDCDGLGVGVHDILRLRGLPVIAFHGQARTDRKDATGELGFSNLRSLAWWSLRELLDPHKEHHLILPKHDGLLGDLCCPRWDVQNQKIVVESKDQIKRRLHRSPDHGDALAYAFCPMEASQFEESYRTYSSAQVDELARHGQAENARSEEAQLESLIWGNPRPNHDVTIW